MKKLASKFAKPDQIQPKFQFLFHKNLLQRDFPIVTLVSAKLLAVTECIISIRWVTDPPTLESVSSEISFHLAGTIF